jgi:hypothetical protein
MTSTSRIRLADDHPDVAYSCLNIAICYHSMGQPARALPLYEP